MIALFETWKLEGLNHSTLESFKNIHETHQRITFPFDFWCLYSLPTLKWPFIAVREENMAVGAKLEKSAAQKTSRYCSSVDTSPPGVDTSVSSVDTSFSRCRHFTSKYWHFSSRCRHLTESTFWSFLFVSGLELTLHSSSVDTCSSGVDTSFPSVDTCLCHCWNIFKLKL